MRNRSASCALPVNRKADVLTTLQRESSHWPPQVRGIRALSHYWCQKIPIIQERGRKAPYRQRMPARALVRDAVELLGSRTVLRATGQKATSCPSIGRRAHVVLPKTPMGSLSQALEPSASLFPSRSAAARTSAMNCRIRTGLLSVKSYSSGTPGLHTSSTMSTSPSSAADPGPGPERARTVSPHVRPPTSPDICLLAVPYEPDQEIHQAIQRSLILKPDKSL